MNEWISLCSGNGECFVGVDGRFSYTLKAICEHDCKLQCCANYDTCDVDVPQRTLDQNNGFCVNCNLYRKKIFNEKQKILCKWKKYSDSEEKREIYCLLSDDFNQIIPINIAIIIDDIYQFKMNYKSRYENDLVKALHRACFCGSSKIAVFILKDLLHGSFEQEKYFYLLGYIASSDNEDFIRHVTFIMKNAGLKTIPNSVFNISVKYKKIDLIKKILIK